MEVLAAIGGGSFLLVCIVGGVRLLLLARRTRQLPEFGLGLGLFLLGGVATPMGAAARSPLDLQPAISEAMLIAQSLMMAAGMGGFALFTQRVFRPGVFWARTLVLLIPLMMLVGAGTAALAPGGLVAAGLELPPSFVLYLAGTLLALGWTGWESLRYARVLQRRMSIGLAEPVVVDRVRLWGIAMALSTVMSTLTIAASVAGIDLISTLSGAVIVGGLGFVAASAIYLAFLPPEAYMRWVKARGAAGV